MEGKCEIQVKKELYARIQQVADEFKACNGSIICRELLGLTQDGNTDPRPEARTAEYYKKRPCVRLVGMAAQILDEYIREQNGGTGR